MMKEFIRQNAGSFLIYLIFLSSSFYLISSHTKADLHLQFNSWVGNSFVDFAFKYGTHLGDGLFVIFVIALFLFISVRKSAYVLFTYMLSTGITQLLKRVFFADVYRPFHHFRWIEPHELKFVDGVEMLISNSFPSGHATAALALFFCLSYFVKNQILKALLMFTGILIAFSRVYLSQHFIQDVVAGSIIALFSFTLIHFVLMKNKIALLNYNSSILNWKRK